MSTITINNTEYNIKYTIRALFIFEQITGKAFEIKTLLDNYLLFYSMILANNKDKVLDWDEFIDALDNDKSLYEQLNAILVNSQKKGDLFAEKEDKATGEKKSRACRRYTQTLP